MLKYRLNTNNFLYKGNNISIDAFRSVDMLGIENRMKKMLICSTKDIDNINVGTKIFSLTKLNISDWTWYSADPSSPDNKDYWSVTPYSYDFVRDYTVAAVDKDKRIFTVIVDKYFELSPTSITFNGQYIDFFFEKSHYFDRPFEGKTVTIHLKYITEDGIETMLPLESEYANINLLRFDYKNADVYIRKALDNIYASGNDLPYYINRRFAEIYREDFFYTDTMSLDFYYDRPLTTLNVPLQQNFETNMYQSEALKTKYIEVEKKNAVNKIVDMERDVYHPVICVGTEVKPVYDIKFNLHFREHRGDDWIASPMGYWNGTYIDSDKVALMKNSEDASLAYFSYEKNNGRFACKDNASCQSDLISYLNFTNNDVKYQKNRLKKSFLRLSFYDSDSLTEQNLLYYSTIYLDSGKLFSKYVRRIEDKPYSMIIYNDNGSYNSVKQNLGGIKVDREPYGTLLDETDIEELRLSSQVTVSDKYNSLASSEGFYIYLWRDNFNGKIPTDLYMKVEFNHAGYGRSIPFMMPYWDAKKHSGKRGVKTFQEILDDWNDEKAENGTDGPYGIRQYLKYSLIHFKYRYDDSLKQHVYYLDNEFYGNDSCDFDNNTIILNLYEAKVSDGSNSPKKAPSIGDGTITSYGSITVTLSYPHKISATPPAEGETSTPTVRADQTVYYQNGTTGSITLNGSNSTYRYSARGVAVNTNTGVVTYNQANNTNNELNIGTVTLLVSANGKTGSAVANVYQEKSSAAGTYKFKFRIMSSDSEEERDSVVYNCGYAGGVATYDIISTYNGIFCDFECIEKYGLEVTVSGNTAIIMVDSLATDATDRNLTLKFRQHGSNNEITVNINQVNSKYEFSINPVELEFEVAGGEKIVNVVSKYDGADMSYDIEDVSSVSWIDYIKKDASDNHIVRVKVDENMSNDELLRDVVFTQYDSNNTQILKIKVKAANVEPDWQVINEYCEIDSDGNNTGKLITEYKDVNILSATYNTTRNEETVDYDRCPLPIPDSYEFEFTDMVIETEEEPELDIELEITKSMSSLLPPSNFGVNMGHQISDFPDYDLLVIYINSFLNQQFKINVLGTDIVLANLEFTCTFYSVPYNYNQMTDNKPSWYHNAAYQMHFPSGEVVGLNSKVLQMIMFNTDSNGYVNHIRSDNGLNQSYPSDIGDMYMFMPTVDTVGSYDSNYYVCMGVESNQFSVTIDGRNYDVKVYGFYGNDVAYGNNGIVLHFNQN